MIVYIYLLANRVGNHEYSDIGLYRHELDFQETSEIQLDTEQIGIYT